MGEQGGLLDQYKAKRHLYEEFTIDINNLVYKLVLEAGLQIFSFENRTKTIESFEGKITREDKFGKYKSLNDITDLSGLRIVAYLKEDCESIVELLRQSFLIDEKNSINKGDDFAVDKFGYQSTHLILSYSDDRLRLPEFKRFSGLKAEVQIKTILQHAWAAIDWKVRYKNEIEAPKELRRRLHRISALLDAADDEFSYVSGRSKKIRESYKEEISSGNLMIDINRDSVFEFLNSEIANKLTRKILEVSGGFEDDNPIVKSENSISRLLSLLDAVGVKSVEDFSKFFSENISDKVEKIAEIYFKAGDVPISSEVVATMLVLLSIPKPDARALAGKMPFGVFLHELVLNAIG